LREYNTGDSYMMFQTIKRPKCQPLLKGMVVVRKLVRSHLMIKKGELIDLLVKELKCKRWEANHIINRAVLERAISKVWKAAEVEEWNARSGRKGRCPSWYVAGPTIHTYRKEVKAGQRVTLKRRDKFVVD
jgi:hypothetical protein